MSIRYLISIALCLFCLQTGALRSDAADCFVGGYAKSYFYLFQPASVEGISTTDSEALLSNRLRIEASCSPSSRIRMNAAYDIAPLIHSQSFTEAEFLLGQVDPFVYRAVDLDTNLYSSESETPNRFVLGQNLDRASLTLRLQSGDFTIGRQAIAWGSARVLNPTDILAPFTFNALDTEDRIGVDAVRARIPVGVLSEIDLGYVFGDDFKFSESAFFARAASNAFRTDFSVLFMGFRDNLLLGADLARPIGGAGYWLETAYVLDGFFNDTQQGAGNDYFRLSTGMDYTFTAKMYGFWEYHFNGAGAALPEDYLSRRTETAYREGSVYLMGRHYLIPGIVYQLTPLITVTGQSLINVTDPSLFVTPQVEYNISSNVYLSAGAFIGIGAAPIVEDVQMPELQSEFGEYPNIYFASLRYYF